VEDSLRNVRANRIIVVTALVFGLAALFLPVEVLEVGGLPIIVAAAYFGGLRPGLLAALWLTLIASISYFVLGRNSVDEYIAMAVGFVVVGCALGAGVEQLGRERLRLQGALDVVERSEQRLTASQRRYRLLFEVSNDAVYLHGLDADGEPTHFVAVNDAACRLFGYSRVELLGLTPRAVDASPAPGTLRRVMKRLLVEERIVYESMRRTRDADDVPVEISSSLSDVDGELLVLSISRDITGRKETERRLERLTLHDDLTGLLNRRGFYVMMPEHAKRAKRSGSAVSLLYGDIDGFKNVNDTLGHKRGDEVLAAVADVLRSTFREIDLIARLGGDEFCVVASGEVDADPAVLERRLDEALAAASEAMGLELSLSHGTVTTDWRGLDDPDEVLTRADMLMYEAKRTRQDARLVTAALPDRPGGFRGRYRDGRRPWYGDDDDAHDQLREGDEPRDTAAGDGPTETGGER
jgi:diguanylate cyclase (GGDEF)-like protein/PAS domain S-box-containing protein